MEEGGVGMKAGMELSAYLVEGIISSETWSYFEGDFGGYLEDSKRTLGIYEDSWGFTAGLAKILLALDLFLLFVSGGGPISNKQVLGSFLNDFWTI